MTTEAELLAMCTRCENSDDYIIRTLATELKRRLTGPSECICEGNWRELVKDTLPLLDKRFIETKSGNVFTLFGIVHATQDYYYGMSGKAGMRLLSCVGSIEGHGFVVYKENET